jgi:CMP-2-keto-3-deoxyoctulosonic acid synthetase
MTYESCLKSKADKVIIATDDKRIAQAVSAFGGKSIMTASNLIPNL